MQAFANAALVTVPCLLLLLVLGCATTAATAEEPAEPQLTAEQIHIIELEQRAAELVRTAGELARVRGQNDEIQRRLTAICVDYPDHRVCQPQTAASFAREAFCADQNFTSHVDEVVRSCHQGQCRQVDDAQLLQRSQYMTLVRRLPHSLILFRARETRLDRADKEQLQHFVEQLQAEGGYIIIVGRASRDGPWRKNLRYALERAEATRQFVVERLGFDATRVGFITYGHEKMYLTPLDAERLANRRVSPRAANRSALVFAYPCFDPQRVGGH